MSLLKRLADALFPPRKSAADRDAREVREAEDRWRAHNAARRAAGCPCGAPASRVRYLGGNIGAVPVEVWSCDVHCGASGWSGTPGAMTPTWERSSPCAAIHRPERT